MSESFTDPVRDMNPATSSAMIDRTCADVSANLAENFCTRVCVSASLMPSRVAVDGRDVACGGSEGDVRRATAQFAGDFQKRVQSIRPHSSSFGIP